MNIKEKNALSILFGCRFNLFKEKYDKKLGRFQIPSDSPRDACLIKFANAFLGGEAIDLRALKSLDRANFSCLIDALESYYVN